MTGLTPTQSNALNAIRRLTCDGVPPSFEELRIELGLASKSGVHRVLHELKQRGRLDFVPGVRRSLTLVEAEADLDLTTLSLAALNRLAERIDNEINRRGH